MTGIRIPDLTMGNFIVLIDGFEPMSMTSVTGIGFEVAILEDAEARGGNGRGPQRSPGVNKNTTVTLSTMELEKAYQLGNWRNKIEEGSIERKHVSIHMHDAANLPVMTFDLEIAWPSAIAVSSVPVGGEGWIQVDVTLAHEGITRKRL
ncbi:MAG: phage tail protein [Chloroflexota bacterium]|nr:phage tail protein [Chloroflexota bacterium]